MWRYERKYRINELSFPAVEQGVRMVSDSFQTSYPDRWINSIYLDTIAFSALEDNLRGISDRLKYRIRWYGKQLHSMKNPILEQKIKHNQLGTKKYEKLDSFNLEKGADLQRWLFNQKPELQHLRPVVLVRYLRSYYETQDHKIRLTIDRKLSYYKTDNNRFFWNSPYSDKALIVELKYDNGMEERADKIAQQLPFRLSKNSKFVNGMLQHY